ncbi:MAG: phytoene/squalene synthase family protein [Cyclobacteriaceae bacterium]|jgi:phytoene synthase|nr:phytoene/squalene synthase family protein [Cyclobacteriaceae bacterium]
MTSKQLFDNISIRTSRYVTRKYSTSFSLGILCLKKELRDPVYALYGWVRFADEIVDTFHDYDKKSLLERFTADTYRAIEQGISLNPILNAFQYTVKKYKIEKELTDTFLKSMEWDLSRKVYDYEGMKEYILGSAEVVGLMCLRIFCEGDDALYQKLKPAAMSLGSAFQKVNFLRDLRADFNMGRVYFPELTLDTLTDENKKMIEASIQADFDMALEGIKGLPKSARFGVYVAYVYYLSLFRKIQNTPSELVLKERIRVRNRHKLRLLAYSYVKHQLNLI